MKVEITMGKDVEVHVTGWFFKDHWISQEWGNTSKLVAQAYHKYRNGLMARFMALLGLTIQLETYGVNEKRFIEVEDHLLIASAHYGDKVNSKCEFHMPV